MYETFNQWLFHLVMSTDKWSIHPRVSRYYCTRQSVARSLETLEKKSRRFASLEKEAKCNSMPDVCKRAEVTAR